MLAEYMTMTKHLTDQLRKGDINIDTAMEKFDITAKHISEGSLKDLHVKLLDCGFPALNENMSFKKDGELVIFGARPSMGKSSFLLQVASHVSKQGPVLFFSLEMSYRALKRRLLSMASGRSLTSIQQGMVPDSCLEPHMKTLSRNKLYIEDAENCNINQIRNKALAFHKHSPLQMVVVDYLQKVPGNGYNRAGEVSEVATGLKKLAKDLGVPVLAAAQLNRACESRGKDAESKGRTPDYRPMGSDIGESDKIQHIADVIIFLSREEVYNDRRRGEADIGTYKNRDGKTGWHKFRWIGNSTRFVDPSESQDSL